MRIQRHAIVGFQRTTNQGRLGKIENVPFAQAFHSKEELGMHRMREDNHQSTGLACLQEVLLYFPFAKHNTRRAPNRASLHFKTLRFLFGIQQTINGVSKLLFHVAGHPYFDELNLSFCVNDHSLRNPFYIEFVRNLAVIQGNFKI